ncbi:Condensin-2 complex subunit D3 [Labeo rohita]|uniref:Condensin-2 complex subunit D3 n=1 Tax=Labeo rohita TaxID=84645 RepID=A0ABQ8N0K5_LABRO|nr:Condensin-2 complex subunit D3 [Labeo rohita]
MQLLPFSNEDDDNTQSVWVVFGENGVSAKSLVAVLSYFILSAKAKSPSLEQRLCGLQAASLYLLLLKIPGSVANKVYHQILFDTCLNMPLKCWPQESGKKRKKDSLKSSQGDPKTGKRSRPPKKVSEEQMEIDEDEDDEEEGMYFSAQDLLKLREGIVLLVCTLLKLLERFSLKDKPQSADSCVQLFTELTNFEPVIGDMNVDQLQSLPELSYHGLGLLCSTIHGEGDECRRRVFRKLLYVILMMKTQERSKPSLLAPSQAVCGARDQAILFISHIVDKQREATLPLLRILVQHICHQMVEKSEYRASGAQAVGKLIAKMPCQDYAAIVKWLYSYSRNNKVAFRMFALDVAMVLLEQSERDVDDTVDPELAVFLSHRFLVHNIIYNHRNDVSPTVRGHALHCLAQCLELGSQNATKCVHELFSNSAQTMLESGRSDQTLKRRDTVQKTALTFRTIELTKHKSIATTHRSGINTSLQNEETMTLFKKHVSDPKTNARKSALETVMSLLKHGVITCSAENLNILSDRCRDPAVSVKKKAMQCLMDLLAALPENTEVQEAWLRGVLPAVMDSESSVQEKALECLDHVVIAHIKSQGKYRDGDTSQKLAWELLGLMCDKCQDLSRYFSKAFSVWAPQQKFTPAFVNGLLSHTEGEKAAAAWLLLAKIASCSPKLNYGTVLETWENTIRSPVVSVTMTCHILSVLGDIASNLNDDTKTRIVDDLMGWLKTFSLPLEVISSCVDTLVRFARSDNTQDTLRFLDRYCGELVSVCESYLSGVILQEKGAENINEDLLVKHLYTLGAASLHCPSKVGKRIFLLVQSVLTPSEQQPVPAEGDELPASQPLSQFKPNSMPTVVRAQAVITLGKLCLQHEELMLKYLPVFARELEVGTELAVRSNVVVVMCDLCVRYTNTVTRYIPNISACLRDKEPIVREQTLIMLTNLLQEEYVKWKGALFFRFAVALVDPDPAIADLCEYCLVDLLLKKSPLMFSQHFIECIFHFNSYDKHKKYNKFPQTESEKSKFSLKGPQNQGKRFRIYKFLLKNFTDEQRFNITTKICQDILATFVDSELPLDSEGSELLADTFDILSLKEMKLTAMSGPAAGEEPQEDEMAMAKAVLQVAQKKLVSQVQKRNFVENVIPIIISLKNMLEEQHSPVLKHLMAYLQLAAEVEYNLKQFEKEKQQQEQQQMENQLGNFTLSPRQNSNAVASPAQAANVGGQTGFATPQNHHAAKGPAQTPKSADALRRRTFAGMVTPVRTHSSPTVFSTGRGKQVGRAISTPQASINEVTFGEQKTSAQAVECGISSCTKNKI